MSIMTLATRQVVSVKPSDPIDHAIRVMQAGRIHHLLVMDGQDLVGIVSDRDILGSVGWILAGNRQHADGATSFTLGPVRIDQIMTRSPRTLAPDESPARAAALMVQHKIGALPIMDQGRLLGIATESDVIRALATATGEAARQLMAMPVSKLMRAHVIYVTPETALLEVIQLFRTRRIRHLPVAVDRRLFGMIADRDALRVVGTAEVSEGRVIPRIAREIMNPDVLTTELNTPLREAMREMLTNGIHSLPVMLGDELTGIITVTDYLREINSRGLL